MADKVCAERGREPVVVPKETYRGCGIWRDTKIYSGGQRRSGPRHARLAPMTTLYVAGPGIVTRNGLRSLRLAKAEIDYQLDRVRKGDPDV